MTMHRWKVSGVVIKHELTHHKRDQTRKQARDEIVEYIEILYSRIRRHTRLGMSHPLNFLNNLSF